MNGYTVGGQSGPGPCHSLEGVEVLLPQQGDGHAPSMVVLLPVAPHGLLDLALLPQLRLRQRRAVAPPEGSLRTRTRPRSEHDLP